MNHAVAHPCVLFALDRESTPFRRLCGPGRRLDRFAAVYHPAVDLLIAETGIGPVRTEQTLAWLVEQCTPSLVVMAGYAGGLAVGLDVGDVVAASEIVDLEHGSWPTTWPGVLPRGIKKVRLLSSPRMIGSPEEKRILCREWQTDAVDMEAATVARFCAARGIPFGCVRSLSDAVHHSLSPQLVSLLAGGQVSILKVLAALVQRPTLLGELLTLARNTRLASQRLAAALEGLLLRKET